MFMDIVAVYCEGQMHRPCTLKQVVYIMTIVLWRVNQARQRLHRQTIDIWMLRTRLDGPGVNIWNVFTLPVFEYFTLSSLPMLNVFRYPDDTSYLINPIIDWLKKRSIMLMTMTHHDGGMRVMTAVSRVSVEEWPMACSQHRTVPRHVSSHSDLTPCGGSLQEHSPCNLKNEAVGFSLTLVFIYHATRRQIPEPRIIGSHCREIIWYVLLRKSKAIIRRS
jgi:hypothetical protein